MFNIQSDCSNGIHIVTDIKDWLSTPALILGAIASHLDERLVESTSSGGQPQNRTKREKPNKL